MGKSMKEYVNNKLDNETNYILGIILGATLLFAGAKGLISATQYEKFHASEANSTSSLEGAVTSGTFTVNN
jgi:hypothetical protein